MTAPASLPNAQLQQLRGLATRDPQAAVQAAARQFEALFMQELLKGMRQSTLASGLLDNPGSKMGTEMLDQQFAQQLSGLPGGLSARIAAQLGRQMGSRPDAEATPAPRPQDAAPAPRADAAGAPASAPPASAAPAAADFIRRHKPAAEAAAQATGLPADFILGQAAHESGWGRREILHPDGRTTHNVFGIKAGPGWSGPTATVMTTEYVDGQPRKVAQTFRAYASYEEAYRDHARLIGRSPRYAAVVAESGSAEGFAHKLQQAGYATDPAYARKLTHVINRTVQLARSLGV